VRPDQIVKEIDKLALSEKIMLVEDIWDEIALKNNQLPMPEWQKTELDKRYKKFKRGNASLQEWETVHEEIRKRYK